MKSSCVYDDDSLESKASIFRDRLENWYHKNHRDFSWRHSRNPFHLLVAEFLLRKTQAERVEPFFVKFCAKYKKPQDVLIENPESLFEQLGNLGLRKRVIWLIEVSQQLVEDYEGEIPLNFKEILRLKGVGPYTASMVLIALDKTALPPIDNNIARLISRVFGIERVGDTRREKEIEMVLHIIFRSGEPRVITFSMLDFTAIFCSSYKPKSEICPLKDICCYNLTKK
jgi:A/G-specific adenine glycosylase